MRTESLSVCGSTNSQFDVVVAGASRFRTRGRVATAVVVGMVCLAGLAVAVSSAVSADEEPESTAITIDYFEVSWEEADEETNLWKFTFFGVVRNFDTLSSPTVKFEGYPFGTVVDIDAAGTFSVDLFRDGDNGFGRTIVAKALDNGQVVSDDAFTST